ncbi:Peptidase S24/S26A/S26B/S26C family protein [Zea mays]|uniref:Peptidase S24/S26A/S26B/S26C family protein n=1 Tax=Zea mays TaxID=4577 RepID=A0A1D6FMG5_MAIZE|nr:Peptidase S24/S26A/S26B/S26C family protein [Zea mays]
MNVRTLQKWTSSPKVTIILGMTDYYMHMGSFGSSNITLWDVLWATFHMLAGLQLS